jgi:hypothetical protein
MQAPFQTMGELWVESLPVSGLAGYCGLCVFKRYAKLYRLRQTSAPPSISSVFPPPQKVEAQKFYIRSYWQDSTQSTKKSSFTTPADDVAKEER